MKNIDPDLIVSASQPLKDLVVRMMAPVLTGGTRRAASRPTSWRTERARREKNQNHNTR